MKPRECAFHLFMQKALDKAFKIVTTLDSGIDIAPGINIAHGTFGKNIKHSP